MRVLAVDIGNSKIAAGLLEDGRVLDRFHGGHADPTRPATPAPRVAAAYDWCTQQLLLEGEPIGGVALASVVPAGLELWMHLWEGKASTRELPIHVVDHRSPLPFEVDVLRPETVGADRWCNVAGAVRLGYRSAVVVDLGTANTYDVLEEGRFRGGLIAPGLVQAHRALLESGAQLPSIPLAAPETLIGRDTVSAIRAGSYHQGVGGVAQVLGLLRERLPGAPILITGGLAEMVAPDLPFEVLFHPDLTLAGAALLLERSP